MAAARRFLLLAAMMGSGRALVFRPLGKPTLQKNSFDTWAIRENGTHGPLPALLSVSEVVVPPRA